MKRPGALAIAAAALAGTIGLVAPASAATNGATLHTRHTSLGTIIVAANGRSLYLFQRDTNHKSHCSGTCAMDWPPLITHGKPHAGHGVKASLLGTTKRKNGKLQVTYNGHPLYYFAGDSSAGQTNGEGLNDFGAHWWVVNKKGHKVTGGASASSTPTSSPYPY